MVGDRFGVLNVALEDGAAPLYVGGTRRHTILGIDPRGFWTSLGVGIVGFFWPDPRALPVCSVACILMLAAFRAITEHQPYAIDEVQRYLAFPHWGTNDADRHAPHPFSPYQRRTGRRR